MATLFWGQWCGRITWGKGHVAEDTYFTEDSKTRDWEWRRREGGGGRRGRSRQAGRLVLRTYPQQPPSPSSIPAPKRLQAWTKCSTMYLCTTFHIQTITGRVRCDLESWDFPVTIWYKESNTWRTTSLHKKFK